MKFKLPHEKPFESFLSQFFEHTWTLFNWQNRNASQSTITNGKEKLIWPLSVDSFVYFWNREHTYLSAIIIWSHWKFVSHFLHICFGSVFHFGFVFWSFHWAETISFFFCYHERIHKNWKTKTIWSVDFDVEDAWMPFVLCTEHIVYKTQCILSHNIFLWGCGRLSKMALMRNNFISDFPSWRCNRQMIIWLFYALVFFVSVQLNVWLNWIVHMTIFQQNFFKFAFLRKWHTTCCTFLIGF